MKYHLLLLTLSLAVGLGCGRPEESASQKPVGLYSDEAIVITADVARKMKNGAADDAAGPRPLLTEEQLYNPQAKIQVELVANGSLTPRELLAALNQRQGVDYAGAVIMDGLASAVAATDPEQARDAFSKQYGELLATLKARRIPAIVCEILPVIPAYQKRGYKLPAPEINRLITQFNRDLYGLALEQAAGFVYTQRLFAGRVGEDKSALLLNEANAGVKNGIQPTVEGMRLLAQAFAHALHAAGYRDGRILLLGDSVMANEALTRRIDKMPFLLQKSLEVELNKTCP